MEGERKRQGGRERGRERGREGGREGDRKRDGRREGVGTDGRAPTQYNIIVTVHMSENGE